MTSGTTGFGAGFGAGLCSGFFAAGGGAAGDQGFGVARLVAAGGADRYRGLLGDFGVVGRSVRFGRSRVFFSAGFGHLHHNFLAAHRHQKIPFGTFAQAQIFLAGQLRDGGMFLILGLRPVPSQQQRKKDK